MASRVKKGPLIAVVGVAAVIYGLVYAHNNGLLGPSTAGSAVVPVQAELPSAPDLPTAATASIPALPLASTTPATVPGPEVRFLEMAWNAEMPVNGANGGPKPTEGSLMQKAGVNLTIIREDDVGKMGSQLINFATAFKKGNPQPSEGAHFMSVMGDGSAATIAGLLPDLKKLGMDVEVIGSSGYSRGEDKFMGLAAWKLNPKLARGALVAGYLRDGDWNIALKWSGDNGIKNNPDEKTWDADAINWYAADDFIKAGNAYIDGVCEDRPVVSNGHRTGEKKHVCVNGVVTWTPGDVNVAQKKGGLVSIVSTKEYKYQMPNTIIGIKQWDEVNRSTVENMLSAIFQYADQIKNYPTALDRAAQASAEIYKEQDAAYWAKYYRGVTEPDMTGVMVELGGTSVNNLQDNRMLFGLLPGSANLFAATYTAFGNIVKQQYPKLVPDLLPVGKVLNTSYVQDLARKQTAPAGSAEVTRFAPNAEMKQVVSKKSWQINFDTGKATFTADTMTQLEELKNGLLIAGDLAIEIEGHTDNTGDPDRNRALSKARAEAVKNWLIQQSSTEFNSDRFLKVVGFGSDKPKATNDTETGRAQNRRVEVTLGTTS
jgi:OOP family OmpA-OmpF porin